MEEIKKEEKIEVKKELKEASAVLKSIREKISSNKDKRNHIKKSIRFQYLWELRLRGFEFYRDKIGMGESGFENTSNIYNKLGQFDYNTKENIKGLREEIETNPEGLKYVYIGQFKDDNKKYEGIGIFVLENGDIFEGYWKNGIMCGQGRYISNAGSYHIGEYNNEKHGYGESHFSSGANYKGQYEKGRMNGYGEYQYSDGKVYRGQWKDSKKNGQGMMIYPDGTEKTGQWENNKFNE